MAQLDAGERNDRLFPEHDELASTLASRVVAKALHKLKSPPPDDAVPDDVTGTWWVVRKAGNESYVGQIVYVLAVTQDDKVYLDWGAAWKRDDGLSTVTYPINRADLSTDFTQLHSDEEDDDWSRLLLTPPADPNLPPEAARAMWSADGGAAGGGVDTHYRLGRELTAYNIVVAGRQWDKFSRGDVDNASNRIFFIHPILYNLHRERVARHLVHGMRPPQGTATAVIFNNALQCGLAAHPVELLMAHSFTAETLLSRYDRQVHDDAPPIDHDEDRDRTERRLATEAVTPRNPGGLFPLSSTRNLSQVTLGRLSTELWRKGHLMNGGWTFSFVGANKQVIEIGAEAEGAEAEGAEAEGAEAEGAGPVTWLPLKEAREWLFRNWRQLHRQRDPMTRTTESYNLRYEMWSSMGTGAHLKRYVKSVFQPFNPVTAVNEGGGDDYLSDEARVANLSDDQLKADEALYGRFVRQKRSVAALPVPGTVHTLDGFSYLHRRRLLGIYDPPDQQRPPWFTEGADRRAMEEHFAANARAIAIAYINKHWKQLCRLPHDTAYSRCQIDTVAAEYPVYWPFGSHTTTPGSSSSKLYETRIDLVLELQPKRSGDGGQTVLGPPSVVVVEYKMRAENDVGTLYDWTPAEAGYRASRLFTLTGSSDRRQAELNSWMLYLCTGVLPTHALVVQATRRRTRIETQTDFNSVANEDARTNLQDQWTDRMRRHLHNPNADYTWAGGEDDTSPFGCVACLTLDWEKLRPVIDRFFRQPYGLSSTPVYMDAVMTLPQPLAMARSLGADFLTVFPGTEFSVATERAVAEWRKIFSARENGAEESGTGESGTGENNLTARSPTVRLPAEVLRRAPRLRQRTNALDGTLPPGLYPAVPSAPQTAAYITDRRLLTVGLHYQRIDFQRANGERDQLRKLYRSATDVMPTLSLWFPGQDWGQQNALLFSRDNRGDLEVACYHGKSVRMGVLDDVLGNRQQGQQGGRRQPDRRSERRQRRQQRRDFSNVAAAGIYRPDATPTQFLRHLQPEDEPPECLQLRSRLNTAVAVAAGEVVETLKDTYPELMNTIPLSRFWENSVKRIYRRGTPRPGVREFGDYPGDPYGPPPPGVPVHRPPGVHQAVPNQAAGAAGEQVAAAVANETARLDRLDLRNSGDRTRLQVDKRRERGLYDTVTRCMHRLVNTRALRGSLALQGVDPTDANIATQRRQEWWRQTVPTRQRDARGRSVQHTREATMPHFSQRPGWTPEALRGAIAAVDTAQRHIEEDLTAALLLHGGGNSDSGSSDEDDY